MSNFIFGSRGFAKEVDFLMHDIFKVDHKSPQPDYFVSQDDLGTIINDKQVISESAFFDIAGTLSCNAFIGIGNPAVRRKIVDLLSQHSNIKFPTLIHPSIEFDSREGKISIGEGSFICAGNILTTDIRIEKHVHINLDCTVGHDTVIRNYCTVSPGCHISGNVYLGENVFLGTGAVILEHVNICNDVVIGAAAVVTKSITESGTYVGMPARKIK